MAILKKLLLFIVALVALLVVVGFFLPASAHVERSIRIDAPICTVFTLVNGFGRFNEWSPWAERDPNARYTYEGPDHGVGAKMSWESDDPNVGVGSQEIVASEPYSLVRTKLDFGSQGQADAFFQLNGGDDTTEVTWGFDSEFGMNLIGRYFGLFFDSMLGGDYEEGLRNLKVLAESQPATAWCDLEVEVVEVEPVTIAYVTGTSSQDTEEIGAALGAAYGQVGVFLAEHGLEQAGAPIAIANHYDKERGYGFDAAIPVNGTPEEEAMAEEGTVKVGQTYGGKVVKTTHKGPYTELVATYEQIEAYMSLHGYEATGRPWEEYVSDPGTTPPEELITYIYYPIGSS